MDYPSGCQAIQKYSNERQQGIRYIIHSFTRHL